MGRKVGPGRSTDHQQRTSEGNRVGSRKRPQETASSSTRNHGLYHPENPRHHNHVRRTHSADRQTWPSEVRQAQGATRSTPGALRDTTSPGGKQSPGSKADHPCRPHHTEPGRASLPHTAGSPAGAEHVGKQGRACPTLENGPPETSGVTPRTTRHKPDTTIEPHQY